MTSSHKSVFHLLQEDRAAIGFVVAKSRATWFAINKPGEVLCEMIFASILGTVQSHEQAGIV